MMPEKFYCAYEWFSAILNHASKGQLLWTLADDAENKIVAFEAVGESFTQKFSIPVVVLKLCPLIARIVRTPQARGLFCRILEGGPQRLCFIMAHSKWGYYPPQILVELNRLRGERKLPPLNPAFDLVWRAVDAALLFEEVEPGEAHPADEVLRGSIVSLGVLEVLILHSGRERARSGLLLLGRMGREWARVRQEKVNELLRYWVDKARIDVDPTGRVRVGIREAVVRAVEWLGPTFRGVLNWEEPEVWLRRYKEGVCSDLEKRSQV